MDSLLSLSSPYDKRMPPTVITSEANYAPPATQLNHGVSAFGLLKTALPSDHRMFLEHLAHQSQFKREIQFRYANKLILSI